MRGSLEAGAERTCIIAETAGRTRLSADDSKRDCSRMLIGMKSGSSGQYLLQSWARKSTVRKMATAQSAPKKDAIALILYAGDLNDT
jgi:hypothetical protein